MRVMNLRRSCARRQDAHVLRRGVYLDSLAFKDQRLKNLWQVICFICGHKLHGRTKLTSGFSTAILSLIEHSVTISTRSGWLSLTHLIMADVEPEKSRLAQHAGCAFGVSDNFKPRIIGAYWRNSSAVNCS